MVSPLAPSPAALQAAIDAINGWESTWTRDASPPWGIHDRDPPPFNRLFGPVHARGGVAGVIHHRGSLLAQWGDVHRSDLTFSVAKTYLALLAGLASDDRLLPDMHEPVVRRCPGIGFEGERHARITWHHLLQQTSEWEGSCLGIPEQVDRYRWLEYQGGQAEGVKGQPRPLGEPGSRFEYNDIRINQLSLALLHVWKRPLPDVFAERILQPLQCTDPFAWEGYERAWATVEGQRMVSVPGGSHWGGGVSISAMDQSRIGLMLMRGGVANGRQILSRAWVDRMQVPCAVAPFYGYLVWLNQGGRLFRAAPRSSWFAIGAGSSLTWIDPAIDLVCVLRWIDSARTNDCIDRIMVALSAG